MGRKCRWPDGRLLEGFSGRGGEWAPTLPALLLVTRANAASPLPGHTRWAFEVWVRPGGLLRLSPVSPACCSLFTTPSAVRRANPCSSRLPWDWVLSHLGAAASHTPRGSQSFAVRPKPWVTRMRVSWACPANVSPHRHFRVVAVPSHAAFSYC